jgi:protein SCO1/2
MARTKSLARPLLIVAVVAAAATAAAISAGRLLTPPSFHGTAYKPAPEAPAFQLTDQNGQTLAMNDLRGRTVLLFFGYTNCPDVCPLTLSKLSAAFKTIGAEPEAYRVVMVTVDPEHDTPAALADYLKPYGPAFSGVTGPPTSLATLAADYGVNAAPASMSAHAMHTAAIFGIDREGRLRVLIRPESPQKEIEDDIRALLHS